MQTSMTIAGIQVKPGTQVTHSPVSGMVIGRLDLPLVHRGDVIIHIAHLDRLKKLDTTIFPFLGMASLRLQESDENLPDR